MKNKKILLLLSCFLLIITLTACNESGSNYEISLRPELIEIKDVEFLLTDELKEYMTSEGLENLVLAKELCRS